MQTTFFVWNCARIHTVKGASFNGIAVAVLVVATVVVVKVGRGLVVVVMRVSHMKW